MELPLLIFDVDGTLCDTCDVDDQCFRETCASATGLDLCSVEWSSAPQVTDQAILEWLWRTRYSRMPSREEVAAVKRDFVSRLEEELTRAPHRFCAIPGALTLLEWLRRRDWDHLAATGGWRTSAALKLRAANLPLEILARTSDDHPDRMEVFRTAALRSVDSAKGRDVVLVGDGVWDVTVARALGWSFIGVAVGANSQRLRHAGAGIVLENLSSHDAFEQAVQRSVALKWRP